MYIEVYVMIISIFIVQFDDHGRKWVHLDDESCVAAYGCGGKNENHEVEMLKQEIEELKQSVIRNENVDGMSAWELIAYETKLKDQMKDLAREITKLYKAKKARRIP